MLLVISNRKLKVRYLHTLVCEIFFPHFIYPLFGSDYVFVLRKVWIVLMCSRNNDLSEEKKRMRIIISGGETEASPCTTITVKGVTFGVLRPTIFRLFFFSLSIQLCKKKKKHCFPSLDHTTPLSPLPFSLSARPLLPSECSRLMHPPLFSLLFFFLLLSQSSLVFFPPHKAHL